MDDTRHPLVERYEFLGLGLMIISEAATLAHIEPFWSWNTPIAWTGFILFADGIVWRARRNSWLRTSPREFALLALVSIPLWLVFEGYNAFIDNWYYVGLPNHWLLRYFGYAWSFATIWPAIFEGAELVAVWRDACRSHEAGGASGSPTRQPGWSDTSGTLRALNRAGAPLLMPLGVAMLLSPFLVSQRLAQYLAAPVWLGFVFLLDPLNARLHAESLVADLDARRLDRLINLVLSGLLCGVLWEFWNYWGRAKWHYTVPIMAHTKIFEMPLPGYLGFPPFALECFTMYVFVRQLYTHAATALGHPGRVGRTIAL